jgi:signal transduction histidine kinase
MRIARDLHDDVGSALGSISFYTEAAQSQLKNRHYEQAGNTFQSVGDTARETIQNIKDIIWMVNPQNDSVHRLIERMRNHLADTCSAKQIAYDFNTSNLSNSLELDPEKRRNIYLIFKEAVYNSIKYSGTSCIRVYLKSDTTFKLTLTISDFGIGLPAQPQQGNGIANMKHRAEEIGAKIEFINDKGLTINLFLK